ncbi:Phthiocerol/phenolphthiocerol synthesis polyketide synthase type I PpsE [Marinomonas spartinae]|uniref:Phthiocerol/phenolphthiocerol synthesis polyketide synthase type I PpsE n=1 Tax=Marinomonas spartinae TaxID=1792290 RepID=A0A1A8TP92_9GAMM|nr:type I polyketide synthase [Marinomonas spartinae]SBS34854.1 Phthiocerol/phenolphthiocerol synthesis polyketide synthase type I PpsE [Marinomonas spartinae]
MKGKNTLRDRDIAIIGMSGRFPGAEDITSFWHNLSEGLETISTFTDEELRESGIDEELIASPNYIPRRGIIGQAQDFDAHFFDFTPRDAEITDPQHRIFLETSWHAFEDAGYVPSTYPGKVGVFGGTGTAWHLNKVQSHPSVSQFASGASVVTNNDKDYVTTRVSYKLNLKGPSVNVQTACSTALVAVVMGVNSLLSGESDLIVAGGVSVDTPERQGYRYMEGGMESADGRCYAFDSRANGTVFSRGVGVVLLKRLTDAVRDGDHIYSVIKGGAINNDGSLKAGFTAPGIEGQVSVAKQAIKNSDIDVENIRFVEAHGTATALGDPIEFSSLSQTFRNYTDKEQFCRLGSVKTNIGHTDAASGVASLIKSSLALKTGKLPASLHFASPNPNIEFEGSPFVIHTETGAFNEEGKSSNALVNSFGVGGTNACVILETAPEVTPSEQYTSPVVIPFSARSRSALNEMKKRFAQFLSTNPDTNLADAAYTMQVGRKQFEFSTAVVGKDRDSLIEALGTSSPITTTSTSRGRPVVFMFPGQGNQYVNMAADLYQTYDVFKQQMDLCCDYLTPILKQDLREIIFPANDDMAGKINETQYTQPSLFVVEYSLAQLWMSWGIKPDVMIGHSVGEYVAACLSGVFSLQDALKAVAIRGQLVQALPAGAMLAVLMDEEALSKRLANSDLDIAAVNYPELCVIAGELEAIKAFQYELEEEGVFCKHLDTSHGFHSSMMDPMLPAFKEVIDGIALHAPSIPFVSSVNGHWITDELAQNSDYWVRHVRNPVLFSHAFKTLMADYPDGLVCLEVGPGRSLESAAKQHLREDEEFTADILASLPTAKEVSISGEHFVATLGGLWACGVAVDWAAFYGGQERRRISLPGYPFERKTFKLPESKQVSHSSAVDEQALKRKKDDIADWFYMPAWKRTVPAEFLASKRHNSENSCWVLFVDEYGVANELNRQLSDAGHQVVLVFKGDSYQVDVLSTGKASSFIINPSSRDDYIRVLRTVKEFEADSVRVVHLWNLSPDNEAVDIEGYRTRELDSFYSPLYLQQALVNEDVLKNMHLVLVGNNIFSIAGEKVSSPEKALLVGPGRVFNNEYGEVQCHLVDIDWPMKADWSIEKAAHCLIAEGKIENHGELVAYRGACRFQEDYQPVKVSQDIPGLPANFKDDGVYLITGGLGGLGLLVAEHIADTCNATLVLTYRSSLPPRDQWHTWIKEHPVDDTMSTKLAGILHLESKGNKVDLVEVDVCDYQGMSDLFASYYHVDGIFHTAGIAGGGIIPLKTDEDCASVLDSKVKGALLLDELTKDSQPDFLILFSSITSLVGDSARIDYCSGNAFLDAFAHYRNQSRSGRTVAINWGKWGDVGMAFKYIKELDEKDGKNQISKDSSGSLLQLFNRQGMEEEYVVNLAVNEDWVIDEHRLSEQPTLVGTTILSLLNSLITEFKPQETLQVKSLLLTKPVIYHHAWPRQLHLFVKAEGAGYSFSLRSRGVRDIQWDEHAIGSIGNKQEAVSDKVGSLEAIRGRCTTQLPVEPLSLEYKNALTGEAFLSLSERWNCVQEVCKGKDEWLIHKNLSREFQEDFSRYPYHPALVDAVSIRCINDITQGNFLPISYGNISFLSPLDVDCYAHIRMKQPYRDEDNTIMVDVVFLSAENKPLLVLENYTLVKMSENNQVDGDSAVQNAPVKLDLADRDILFYEGLDALKRQLSHLEFEQLFVLTSDLNQLVVEGRPEYEEDEVATQEAQVSSGHTRPELTVEYVAPENDIEQEIASVWQSVLGISGIGVNDNFVELGGNSLLAVQVVSKVSAKFEVGIRVDLFYKNQTIKGLSEQVFDAFESVLLED